MTDEKAIEKMLYDQQQGWPLCPRCGERMPDNVVAVWFSLILRTKMGRTPCTPHYYI